MHKIKMNIAWAVVILLAVAGVIFINVRGTKDMYVNNTNEGAEEGSPSGAVVKEGDMIAMAYTGRLEDGTVFDSNVDPKFGHVEPFVFVLGEGQVIPGWDKGIVGMKVGEKKTLVIPPEDAYGASGIPGVIPPDATLIFEVELLAIQSR